MSDMSDFWAQAMSWAQVDAEEIMRDIGFAPKQMLTK